MHELAYMINAPATLQQECLVLDLAEAIRESGGYTLISIGKERPLTEWRTLAKEPVDQEAFQFLLKEELIFAQRQQSPGSRRPLPPPVLLRSFRIPPSKVRQAFSLLSATQKLHCEGKQLIVDLFGQAEWYYEASPLPEGRIAIEGRLRWRDTDIAFSECRAIAPGDSLWFVHGWILKMIRPTLTWKKAQELRRSPLILEGHAKHLFFDNLHPEDPEEPRLEVKAGTSLDLAPASPYPLLILKDRWGACADLWMDYGEGRRIAFHDRGPLPLLSRGAPNKRQSEAEASWERDLLETDFIKKIADSSHYYCPLDRVTDSLTFLLEVGWSIQDKEGRSLLQETAREFRFHDRGDSIAVEGSLRYHGHEASLPQTWEACQRRDSFIPLSPNTVGLLSLETQHLFRQIAKEIEWVAGEARIKKNRWGTISALGECSPGSPKLNPLKRALENFAGIEEAPPSPAFLGTLRPYQQQGVNWLAFLHAYGFHGILADEMGLGKTIQTLAFFSRIPKQGPHLIVMPTSLLFNWRHEIEHFLPSWRCLVHHGPERSDTEEALLEADILLTSYTTLRLDLPLLRRLSYTCLVLDEAQMIKNAHTQTAKTVRELSAQLRLCLTGTPVENRPQELWSHFHFLMPDLFGSQADFETSLQAGLSDRRHLETLKRKASPFILKRRKQEVATDLPPRIDQTVWITMSEEQRIVYERVLTGFKSGLLKKVEAEGVSKHRMEILEAILRLRQLCCHPLLLSSLFEKEEKPPSAKFEALLEDLSTMVDEGRKVLVYSQFTSMLGLMVRAAREREWPYYYLDGSTSNREEVVDQFQKGTSPALFFISLKAGGVGLNLTAADYVYLYDPWWNEAVEEQAINRAHRIGRENHVVAKRLVMAETIEEKMMTLKASKRSTIEGLLDGEGLPSHLTPDDLRELLC